MENLPMIISLAVAVFMAICFLSGKQSYGLITMTCAAILALTKVLTIPEAFSGFSNLNNILLATMFVLSAALQKTNVPYWATQLLSRVKTSSDRKFAAIFFLVFLVLIIFIPDVVSIALAVSFLQLLPKKEGSQATASRMIMPMLILVAGWYMAVPIGMGASMDFMINSFIQGIVPENQLLTYGTLFGVRLPAALLSLVYIIFMWNRYPDTQAVAGAADSGVKIERSKLPKWKEILVYVMMLVTIAGLLLNKRIGEYTYLLPVASAILIGWLRILTLKELTDNLLGKIIWMMVGIYAVTTSLSKTGANDLIGQALSPLISWTHNGFLIILIVCIFAAVMTTFLSNTATSVVLSPLAASVAMQAGMNPLSLVLAVNSCAMYAFVFPSGSATTAMAYDLGQYKCQKLFKYNIPLLIGMIFITAVTISIVYPPYG